MKKTIKHLLALGECDCKFVTFATEEELIKHRASLKCLYCGGHNGTKE